MLRMGALLGVCWILLRDDDRLLKRVFCMDLFEKLTRNGLIHNVRVGSRRDAHRSIFEGGKAIGEAVGVAGRKLAFFGNIGRELSSIILDALKYVRQKKGGWNERRGKWREGMGMDAVSFLL